LHIFCEGNNLQHTWPYASFPLLNGAKLHQKAGFHRAVARQGCRLHDVEAEHLLQSVDVLPHADFASNFRTSETLLGIQVVTDYQIHNLEGIFGLLQGRSRGKAEAPFIVSFYYLIWSIEAVFQVI